MDDKTLLTDDHITFLLSYCSNVPELYNKISNMLYKNFSAAPASLALVCTFITNEISKEDNK